jgi:hypothetical protein
VSVVASVAPLAACSSSEDATLSTDPPTTGPPAEDPSASGPASSDPASSDPATTVPAVTDPATSSPPDPVSTDPPATDPATYCARSADFYVVADALDLIGDGDDAAVGLLLTELQRIGPDVVAAAPTPEAAEPPTAALEAVDTLVAAFVPIGFDLDRLGELDDLEAVDDAFKQFDSVLVELETFLVESCGEDLVELSARSAAYAAEIAGTGTVVVTDDDGTIEVRVPTGWVEVDGTPNQGVAKLAASPDVDAFLASFLGTFTVPGVVVSVGRADGSPPWAEWLATTEAGLVQRGCEVVESFPYADVIYSGEERILDCPGTEGLELILVAGADADGAPPFLVAMVVPVDDLETQRTILDSFFVG